MLLVAFVAATLPLSPGAAGLTVARSGASGPQVSTGLRPGSDGACRGAYVVGATALCSHGPDPVPAWVRARGGPRVVSQALDGSSSAVGCDGNGGSGKRVQALYVYVAGRANRLASWRSSMRSWAAYVDSMFNNSAKETGGNARLRWVTNNCLLSITAVKIPSAAETNFGTMISELTNRGYNRSDRKYLVWFDSDPNISTSCGLGTIANDDQPGTNNANNQQVGYARVDYVCWDFSESHELMHTLGGVQLSAPHSSGHWHCTDENDQMCYPDGAGVVMTYPCADQAHSDMFDCGHDDYFDTAPGAGSYLADHWNAARSDWVIGGEVAAQEPPPTVQAPTVGLAAGTRMTTTTLAQLSWPEAADPSAVSAYQLQRQKDGGSWLDVALAGSLANSVEVSLFIGSSYGFRLRAVNADGTPGPWALAPAATVTRLEETAVALTYSGTFKRRVLSGASEDHVRKTSASGGLVRLSFSGTSVAFVSTIAPARGIAEVRVDGDDWQSVDFYGASTLPRQVVWATTVDPGSHMLEIAITGGRNPLASASRIDIDAFLVR